MECKVFSKRDRCWRAQTIKNISNNKTCFHGDGNFSSVLGDVKTHNAIVVGNKT